MTTSIRTGPNRRSQTQQIISFIDRPTDRPTDRRTDTRIHTYRQTDATTSKKGERERE
ncbi:hypothetical protein LOAG_09286, partial [Loa loa]